MAPMSEERLYGGLVPGRCVRVGDTVRRPWLRSSEAVQDLLRYLESRGFDGAPRALGRDGQGREIVSWVDGEPSFGTGQPQMLHPGAMQALGAFALRVHEALDGYRPPPTAQWQAVGAGGAFVHGDFGTWNILWAQGKPVAVVDWELAGPGERLRDLALLAKSAVPLVPDDHAMPFWREIPPRQERLEELCSAYRETSGHLLAWMLATPTNAPTIVARGRLGEEPWATYYKHGLHERELRDHEWLRSWCRKQGILA
jgi:hypothetical protein